MNISRFLAASLVAIAAFAAGAGWHAWSSSRDTPWAASVQPLVIEPTAPQLSQDDVADQRRGHYADINRIAQILTLPTTFARHEALYALAGRADVRDLDRYIADASALRDETLRHAALETLFSRYAELAPTRALEALKAVAPDDEHVFLSSIFSTWSKLNLDDAIEAANRQSDPAVRRVAGEAVLRAQRGRPTESLQRIAAQLNNKSGIDEIAADNLVEKTRDAPEEAIAAALKLTTRDLRNMTVMRELGRRDPVRALSMADQFATPALARASRQTVFEAWAESDMATALRQLEALPDSADKRELQQILSYQFAQQSPEKAIDWARQMQGPAGRQLFMAVLGVVAERAPEQALEAARGTDSSGDRTQVFSSVLSMMAWSRPELAVQHLDELQSGSIHDNAVMQIASTWAERDPDAAFAWAEGLDGRLRARAQFTIANHLAYSDPDRAGGFVERLTGGERDQLIVAVAEGFAQHDIARATTWITGFQDEPVYARVTSVVAQSGAQHDPYAALQLVDSIADTAEKNAAVNSIVHTWANTDAPAAADYVERVTDLSTKLVAVQPVANSWAAYDVSAARGWVSSLQPDEVRDQGLLGLIPHAGDKPGRYLSLIEAIKSDEIRTDAIQQSVQHLAYRDRDAARALLDKSDASAEQKEALQCFLDDPSNFRGY